MAWDYPDFQIRQILNDVLDTVLRVMVPDNYSTVKHGPGQGHFTDVFLRPIPLPARSETALFGLICTGSLREVADSLAGFTGAVIVPLTIVEPFMWLHPLIMMMAVVVLGGLGSIKGSFIAAYILGFAEALVVFVLPMGAFLKGSVALSIMILVLLVRPEGLFGIAFEEER